MPRIVVGCVMLVVLAGLLALASWAAFTNASQNQPAADCYSRMNGRILEKTKALPDDATLMAKDAKIEHVLYGNEKDVRRAANLFAAHGWKTRAEPMDEIGWGAFLVEDPTSFKARPSSRILQLCAIAEQNHLQYRSWWIDAPSIADYVSQ